MVEPALPHVVVVGGGIAGLSAALFLLQRGGMRITVLEGSPSLGGKLRTGSIGGLAIDVGAESLLVRRPEGVELARAVGLGDELIAPATTSAALWTRGRLRPLPAGQVMGVPTDAVALARSRVLTPAGVLRAGLDLVLPRTPVGDDVAVGRFLAARLGREVVDRLVEPLLGGVYAGRADELSLRATVPQLVPVLDGGRSVVSGLRAVARAARTPHGGTGGGGRPAGEGPPPRSATGPRQRPQRPQVFAGLPGGIGRLPGAIAAVLTAAGVQIRTSATVRACVRSADGWRLTVGSAHDPEFVDADAVVLAVPAAPASRLLAEVVPSAASALAGIEYASVGVLAFAFPASAFPVLPSGSGFLVPPVDGRMVKAATFSSLKWGWLRQADPDLIVVRCSVGRAGASAELQHDDSHLLRAARVELAEAVGVRGDPLDAQVTRWGGALPQYAVGHLDLIASVRSVLAAEPTLAVCGAAYDGVGIPACVASARLAADRLADELAIGGDWSHG